MYKINERCYCLYLPEAYPHSGSCAGKGVVCESVAMPSQRCDSSPKECKPQPRIVMKRPILYIKPGCPWCREAVAYLQHRGVNYDVRDVTRSTADLQRMIEVSGQTLTPTLEFEDFVVADFSINELVDALNEVPEMRAVLGLSDHLENA